MYLRGLAGRLGILCPARRAFEIAIALPCLNVNS